MRREAMLRAAGEKRLLRRPEEMPLRMVECPVCEGSGKDPRSPDHIIGQPAMGCPHCRGQGKVPRILGGH